MFCLLSFLRWTRLFLFCCAMIDWIVQYLPAYRWTIMSDVWDMRKKENANKGRGETQLWFWPFFHSVNNDRQDAKQRRKSARIEEGEREKGNMRIGEKEGVERRKMASTSALIVSTWLELWGSDQFDRTRTARRNRRRLLFTSSSHIWPLRSKASDDLTWNTHVFTTHTRPSTRERRERKRFISFEAVFSSIEWAQITPVNFRNKASMMFSARKTFLVSNAHMRCHLLLKNTVHVNRGTRYWRSSLIFDITSRSYASYWSSTIRST